MTRGLTPAVERAMREAARTAIMPRFRTPAAAPVADKGGPGSGEEPVTAADRESEAILSAHLSALVPGSRVVGEEAVHHRPELLDAIGSGACWIVDPLDGTANFAAGTGPFGILVALAQDGVTQAGWILDPLSGRFIAAEAGKGATVDGAPFRTRGSGRSRSIVAVTRLMRDEARRARLIAELARDCDVQDSPRCAADQYPRIAMGGADMTLFTRTLPWDHAAGILFLNEAGGRAARPDGTAYRCDDAREGLIAAATPEDWDRAARRLADMNETLALTAQSA